MKKSRNQDLILDKLEFKTKTNKYYEEGYLIVSKSETFMKKKLWENRQSFVV